MTKTEFEQQLTTRLHALAELAPTEPQPLRGSGDHIRIEAVTGPADPPSRPRWLAAAAAALVFAGGAAFLTRPPAETDIAVDPTPIVEKQAEEEAVEEGPVVEEETAPPLFVLPASLDGYQAVEFDREDLPTADTGTVVVVGRETANGFSDVSQILLLDQPSFAGAQANATIGGRQVQVEDYVEPVPNPAFAVQVDDGRWLEFRPAQIELREALLDAVSVTGGEIVFVPFDGFELLARTDQIEETRVRVVSLGPAPESDDFFAIITFSHPSDAGAFRFSGGSHERVTVRGREGLLDRSVDPNGRESVALSWIESPGQGISLAASVDVDIVELAEGLRVVDEASWVAELEALEPFVPRDLAPALLDGWQAVQVPREVAAWDEVLVWTGDELLFWGGQDATSQNVPTGEPGMAYDPDARTWRTLAAGPKPAAVGAAGVWTGEALIVTGGGRSLATAAYDPATDTWTDLAESPLVSEFTEAAWTGEEVIVAGASGVAVYQPDTDQWRLAEPPPTSLGRLRKVAWTGTELIVWPAAVERAVSQGLAFDPATNTWRVLPDPPTWPAAPDVVWTGEQLIIWGALPSPLADDSERAVGSMYDPANNTWTELPEPLPEPQGCECNIGSQTLVWTGSHLIVSTGYLGSGLDRSEPVQLLRFDPQTNRWVRLGVSPIAPGATSVMADGRIVVRSDDLYLSEPNWMPPGDLLP